MHKLVKSKARRQLMVPLPWASTRVSTTAAIVSGSSSQSSTRSREQYQKQCSSESGVWYASGKRRKLRVPTQSVQCRPVHSKAVILRGSRQQIPLWQWFVSKLRLNKRKRNSRFQDLSKPSSIRQQQHIHACIYAELWVRGPTFIIFFDVRQFCDRLGQISIEVHFCMKTCISIPK